VLPKHLGVAWAEYLPDLHLVETLPAGKLFTSLAHLPAKQLFEVFVVEQGPPPGVLATDELPGALWSLPRASLTPTYAFVLNGRLAGVSTSVQFDGGATTSFVDSGLVKQYGLAMRANPQTVRMANGSTIISPGTVQVHLQIQKYTSAVTLHVLPLVPGLGVVIGDDWARRHQLLVDYGVSALTQAPSLLLRSKRLRLFPLSTPHVASGASTLECHIISAKQAACMLAKRRSNCKLPFLVLVSDASETLSTPDSKPSSTDPRLTSILNSYSDVFEQPSTGLVDDLAAPSISLEPDAVPPNHPAFRLSLLERQELESQVSKMLEKGWIQPSSCPFGAPVLFVPKADGSLGLRIDYGALNKMLSRISILCLVLRSSLII
jgi:hypothetical protein